MMSRFGVISGAHGGAPLQVMHSNEIHPAEYCLGLLLKIW